MNRLMLRTLLLGLLCSLLLAASLIPRASASPPVEVALSADLSGASLRQVEVIRLGIEAARIIDEIYREQAQGFYPPDMSDEEFAAWEDRAAANPFTMVRRDADGILVAVPYHEAWPGPLGRVARLLARAAELTDDEALRWYLVQRARALLVGDYRRAENAWQALRHSDLQVLIGPVGADGDARFGIRASFGAYVLMRDWAWGAQLARFMVFLPELQQALPVSPAFRAEVPDVEMKLAVYDLLYHAGYGTAERGTVAADTAADRRVRLQHGPRRLQLRNVMQARFETLVAPVAGLLLAPEEQARVGFEAFFLNTMLHEMAHELGPRETLVGGVPVTAALGEYGPMIEEAKAATLSLWMVLQLHERGELPGTTPAQHYASFLAGLFRAVHLESNGARADAGVLVFNSLRDWGAIRRDPGTGAFYVDPRAMPPALEALAAQLITLQGAGDAAGAAELAVTMAAPRAEFVAALARLRAAGVPSRIVFRLGEAELGL